MCCTGLTQVNEKAGTFMLGNDGGVSALFLHNYDTSGEGQSPAVYMSLNNLKNVNLEAFFLHCN